MDKCGGTWNETTSHPHHPLEVGGGWGGGKEGGGGWEEGRRRAGSENKTKLNSNSGPGQELM